jgi:hypothetical protein
MWRFIKEKFTEAISQTLSLRIEPLKYWSSWIHKDLEANLKFVITVEFYYVLFIYLKSMLWLDEIIGPN